MKRLAVESSSIRAIGYDPDTETLEVLFQTGAVYQYFQVPSQVYEAFMSAESKGTFMNTIIKKDYACAKM